jgi:hypothetical protein
MVLVGACARAEAAPYYVSCPGCKAQLGAVTSTTIPLEVLFSNAGPLPGTNQCEVEYGPGVSYTNRRKMVKGALGFTTDLVALPPGASVYFRVSCDARWGPPDLAKTLMKAVALPPAPKIVLAKHDAGCARFEFTSALGADTVAWFEVEEGSGHWYVMAETTSTKGSGALSLCGGGSTKTRLGVRTSGGSVYSRAITIP